VPQIIASAGKVHPSRLVVWAISASDARWLLPGDV